LPYVDFEIANRRIIANYYLEHINNSKIILPNAGLIDEHVWHLFVIRTKNRDRLNKYLSDNGIQTIIHYPIPPHKQKCFSVYNSLKLPITEMIHNEVISLPISPFQKQEDVEKVVEIINKYND
jgi:dTDP-4-amino-4,6-dideoxygalactose transaminase